MRQVVEVNGRIYDVSATTTGDDRIRMEVLSSDTDGAVISQLTGTVPADDLAATIAAVNRLLTATSLLYFDEVPARASDNKTPDTERQHPNVGKKWEPVDDELLVTRYKAGTSIRELSKVFGRKPGGIRSRLIKHGLIEVTEPNRTDMGSQEVGPAETAASSGHQGPGTA